MYPADSGETIADDLRVGDGGVITYKIAAHAADLAKGHRARRSGTTR
jgi:thiamine biosynthesis protein ThiC